MSKSSDIKGKKGAARFLRVGPLSAQKQVHRGARSAPVGRGMFAFPWPFFDWFFAFHRLEEALPKRLKNEEMARLRALKDAGAMSEEDYDRAEEKWCEERDEKIKELKKRHRPKVFWHDGPIYSRIPPSFKMHPDAGKWHLHASASEFVKKLKGQVGGLDSYGGTSPAQLVKFSADHLEVFIPMEAPITRGVKEKRKRHGI